MLRIAKKLSGSHPSELNNNVSVLEITSQKGDMVQICKAIFQVKHHNQNTLLESQSKLTLVDIPPFRKLWCLLNHSSQSGGFDNFSSLAFSVNWLQCCREVVFVEG